MAVDFSEMEEQFEFTIADVQNFDLSVHISVGILDNRNAMEESEFVWESQRLIDLQV